MMAIRPSSETASAGPEQVVTTIHEVSFELASQVTATVTVDTTEFSRQDVGVVQN